MLEIKATLYLAIICGSLFTVSCDFNPEPDPEGDPEGSPGGFVSCGDPGTVSNGHRTTSGSFQVGSIVTYTCIFGYRLLGRRFLSCQNNGQWSSTPPTCIPTDFNPEPDPEGDPEGIVSCFDPGFIPNSRRSAFGPYTVGSVVTYTCDFGFQLQGHGSLSCQPNGQWSASLPTCIPNDFNPEPAPEGDPEGDPEGEPEGVVRCSDPGTVWNGYRFPDPATYFRGSTLTFQCNQGYQLVGPSAITCLSNGQWSGTPPACRPTGGGTGAVVQCIDPGQVLNARRDRGPGPFSVGMVVTYTCINGFHGWGQITCQPNGQWSQQRPTCTVTTCQDPGQVLNALRHGNVSPYRPGDVITYTCFSAYTGGGSITCQQGGTWTQRPECAAVTCGDPPPLLNGEYNTLFGPYTVTSSVAYHCDAGYEPRGNTRITCGSDGQWSGPRPTCTRTGTANNDTKTTWLPPLKAEPDVGELARVSGDDDDDDDDDDTTNILLGVFGTLIWLVLIAILAVVLMKRRGVHPISTMTAWWKKKISGSSNNNNSNNGQEHRVESGYQGNPIPTVMTSQGIGAVNNNVYMNGYEGFVNKPGVLAAETPVRYATLKAKEAQLAGGEVVEAPVSLKGLKEKEAQLYDEPPPDSHYEQVHDQKA